MKPIILSLISIVFLNLFISKAQPSDFAESTREFQLFYVMKHEVVKGNDKKLFRFFPPGKDYRLKASFEKLNDSTGFIMKTSGTKEKKFYRYGRIRFTLHETPIQLTIYRSEQLMNDTAYKNYLFLPFTDATSGKQSYGGGRYIDLSTEDIVGNTIVIDFNKAYNPYCAYASGYNCPIPPRENNLPVAIKAGEKDFGKSHK